MYFYWYAGFEFQKAGRKSGMQDWATPPPIHPSRRLTEADIDIGFRECCMELKGV